MPGLPSLAQHGGRRHTLQVMGSEVAIRGGRARRLRAAVLALLALLAFLPPGFAKPAQAEGMAGSAEAGFALVICTADGLIVLSPDQGGEREPAQPQHDLSCLACLLRLASPPPAIAAAPPRAAEAAPPAMAWAVADAAPRARPHLRPDKTGPPSRA
jgi:hypothetical protein